MTGPGKRRPPGRKELDPARRAAFDVLRAVSERDAYANLALPAILRERGIHGRDAAFAVELTYGTCRTRGLLDAVIAHAAGRPIDQIDPVLLDLLRLGTYQLLRTRVGQHAAVSTTVEQAGHRIRHGASGIRQRRAAQDRRARRTQLGRRARAGCRRATRSGIWRSRTPIRDGSRRRSPTRSGADAGELSARCWPATTPAPTCTSRPGRAR